MNVLYKWILSYDSTSVEIHPVYKSDLALEYQLETGQKFYRGKLNGKINLVGHDADLVIGAPFYTEFNMLIQKRTDEETQWNDYYQCRFYKTDCTINEDDRKVSVQPSVVDAYNAVLNGLEKEYNLVELPVAIQPITAEKRPMIQIYTYGDDIVTCISGGQSFETDRINDDVTPQSCHFGVTSSRLEFNIEDSAQGFQSPFIGSFNGVGKGTGARFVNNDNIYYIEYYEYDEETDYHYYYNGLLIKRVSDDETIWSFNQSFVGDWVDLPSSITFTAAEGQSVDPLQGNKVTYNVYCRLVCDVEQISIPAVPQPTIYNTYKIGSNDIVANNRNYRYCLEFQSLYLEQSNRLSDTPTKYGRRDDGKYFLPPNDISSWIPVGQSQWVNSSVWTIFEATIYTYEQAGVKQFVIKDTYPLSSVISVLLSKVAPSITHGDSAVYSHFLYDDTVATGIASLLNNTRPYISPKSNILIGEYQEPAMKAPCTLKMIFEMLKKVYGCYWYIDSSNRLVIEHLQWFKNGGSYNSSPSIGYDLTTLENLPNGKKWAFATSEYQYDKSDMPARYQYEWMDDTTDLFDGNPINILSPFVLQDKVEEVSIANFTSDVSYMLLAPENCSKDGFALLQATLDDGDWILPVRIFNIGTKLIFLQNYYVSMWWLQRNLITYDMPSWSIEIDGTATTSAGIQKGKKQTLSFPVGVNDPNMMQLVKTFIGNGQYDKLSINLSSRTAKVTLKYNTYDN